MRTPFIPAKAGTQRENDKAAFVFWVPAYAGTNG